MMAAEARVSAESLRLVGSLREPGSLREQDRCQSKDRCTIYWVSYQVAADTYQELLKKTKKILFQAPGLPGEPQKVPGEPSGGGCAATTARRGGRVWPPLGGGEQYRSVQDFFFQDFFN